jgi:hypothetical protein
MCPEGQDFVHVRAKVSVQHGSWSRANTEAVSVQRRKLTACNTEADPVAPKTSVPMLPGLIAQGRVAATSIPNPIQPALEQHSKTTSTRTALQNNQHSNSTPKQPALEQHSKPTSTQKQPAIQIQSSL